MDALYPFTHTSERNETFMKTYAFVGGSGTGKSYRAAWVANKYNIKAIIDDGLLVCENKVLAGFSAKREATKLASVRRALFTSQAHANEVKAAIAAKNPESLMILGTSDAMVISIAKKMGIEKIDKIIRIEDVATKEEIENAISIRRTEGKHVIPVPTFEIKKDFSGYFLDSMQVLFKGRKSAPAFVGSKSVVRPTFSYLGEYHISNNVISTICSHEANRVDGIHKVMRVSVSTVSGGVLIDMDVVACYGINIPDCIALMQQYVLNGVENLTSVNVSQVNVNVRTLHVEGK